MDRREEIELANATLSGGARLASASGTLPNRITVAATQTIALGTIALACGPCWDADGLHVWHASYNESGNNIKKWRVSDGAEITASRVAPGGTLMGVTRDGAGMLIVAGYGSKKFYVVNPSTLAVTTVTPSDGHSPYQVVRDSAGNFWSISFVGIGGGLLREYASDGTATGRSIAGNWTCVVVHPSIPGYFWCISSSPAIRKYDIATLTPTTFTTSTAYSGLVPGESWTPIAGCADSTGRLYVWMSSRFKVDRWPAAGGSADATVMWQSPGNQLDHPVITANSQIAPFISYSIDDTWLAWMACTSGATEFNAIRARCVGTQRARFAKTFSVNATVKQIIIPGRLGRTKDATYDYRATRCYYSTDGGSTRTEFSPDDDLTLAVANGQTLTIDVDFCLRDLPPMADPYVGDSSGNGIWLVYDDPSITGPTSGIPASATTLTAIKDNYQTVISALTPTSRPRSKYHACRDPKETSEGLSSADLRLFAWTGGAESKLVGCLDPSCRLVEEHLVLEVVYPTLPGLYPPLAGKTDTDALEAVVLADAVQIRDALFSGDNYLAGQCACDPAVSVSREDDGWILKLDCAVTYYKTQTL